MRVNLGQPSTSTVQALWLNSLRNGKAFVGAASAVSDATHGPAIDLFNPLGSGVFVVLHRVSGFIATGTVSVFLSVETVALGAGAAGLNLLAGGAASAALVFGLSTTTPPSTQKIGQLVGATASIIFLDDETVELAPGHGVVISAAVNSSALTATFFWQELNTQ